MLAQDLHADGALPGDDVRIVIGVDEGQALLHLHLTRMSIGFIETLAVEHDAATLPFHRLDLDGRCGAWHHDGRLGAQSLSGEGHALRMISGRGADHAPLEGLAWQAHHLGVGAAQLEREHRLKIFALEPNGTSQTLRQARHGIERALDRHIVDSGSQDLADVVLHVSDAFSFSKEAHALSRASCIP